MFVRASVSPDSALAPGRSPRPRTTRAEHDAETAAEIDTARESEAISLSYPRTYSSPESETYRSLERPSRRPLPPAVAKGHLDSIFLLNFKLSSPSNFCPVFLRQFQYNLTRRKQTLPYNFSLTRRKKREQKRGGREGRREGQRCSS